ncbi:MAG: hypothetical protein KDC54_18175 [Lewinella sp.]|nr:hypothetical protein [Lewinella sp.]
MQKTLVLLLSLVCLNLGCYGQRTAPVDLTITLDPALLEDFAPEGRLFIFLNENMNGEPYQQLWPLSPQPNHIFADNRYWKGNDPLFVRHSDGFVHTSSFSLSQVPAGTYRLQVFWDQDTAESRINAPGNIYSAAQTITLPTAEPLKVMLDQRIPTRSLVDNPLVKEVSMRSELLSEFWGHEVTIKASVLLPSTYFEQTDRTYPVRYNVAGYGGRYTRINNLIGRNSTFAQWWNSEEAPQIVNVFLDGEGPFGDNYHLDSENSGPYGSMLTQELIPYIESTFRGRRNSTFRFVDGCSTGGWVSLALQLFYPDTFNGVWSYSPDAIAFSDYQLINVYEDENAFVNEWGNPHGVARDLTGDVIVNMEDFIRYENVLGASNTFVNSGGQFSAHNALYSPRGADGLPMPAFDPETGVIDKDVIEHWRQYDLTLLVKDNWVELGPKLQGKIYIWMGDMDHFYLNPATRTFDAMIHSLDNPVSDAVIEFEAMAGHCQNYDQMTVLQRMQERVEEMEKR